MMPYRLYTIFLLALSITPVFSFDSDYPENAIDIHITSFLSGIGIGYSHQLSNKVGVQFEGIAYLWDVYGQDASGFRANVYVPLYIHKTAHHRGISAPYLAPNIKYEHSSVQVSEGRSIYYYEEGDYISSTTWTIDALNLGCAFGRRWVFDNNFSLGFRAGYGVFVMFINDWGAYPEVLSKEYKEDLERTAKLRGGVDFVFHMGFAF